MFKLVGIHFITTLLPCSILSASRFPVRWSYNRPFAEMMGFIWINIHLGTHYVPSLGDYWTINCQKKKYCTGRLMFPKAQCKWPPGVHFVGELQPLVQVTKGTDDVPMRLPCQWRMFGPGKLWTLCFWESYEHSQSTDVAVHILVANQSRDRCHSVRIDLKNCQFLRAYEDIFPQCVITFINRSGND